MEQNLYAKQSLLYHGWCMWVALLALSLSLLMVPCIEEGLMQKRRYKGRRCCLGDIIY